MEGIIVLIIYILGIILTVFGFKKITIEGDKINPHNEADLPIFIFGLIFWPSTLCGLLVYVIFKGLIKLYDLF